MADLRSELLAIRDEYGALTPGNIVAAAAPEDHPLHDRFEWDDTVAGHQYRLVQARQLIRVVHERYVSRAGEPLAVRAFHAVPRETGMVYEPAAEIVNDDFASRLLLQQMERDWRLLRRRYERFTEFRDLVLGDLRGETG